MRSRVTGRRRSRRGRSSRTSASLSSRLRGKHSWKGRRLSEDRVCLEGRDAQLRRRPAQEGADEKQRIELDLSPPQGQQGKAPPLMLRILSPEEAAYALQGPGQTAQVQQQEQQKIATQPPSETP